MQILINDKGEVESASAVSGHPYLRSGAEEAALEAKFKTSFKAPRKISCILIYVVKPEDFEQLENEDATELTNL